MRIEKYYKVICDFDNEGKQKNPRFVFSRLRYYVGPYKSFSLFRIAKEALADFLRLISIQLPVWLYPMLKFIPGLVHHGKSLHLYKLHKNNDLG